MSKWECEASIPDIETLFDIAKILQTSLDDLFQAREMYCLGIDGGGTKTDLALVDREGSLIRTLKVSGESPHKLIQLMWCILLILLPIALVFSESSMSNLQSVSIIAAFPIGIVMVLIAASFLKDAGRYLKEIRK